MKKGNITWASFNLSEQDLDEYYNQFSNAVLWPAFHYRLDLVQFQRPAWDGYLRVNALLADKLLAGYKESIGGAKNFNNKILKHIKSYLIMLSAFVIGAYSAYWFFGARANLAKTMLYAINGGVDEKLKMQVGPKSEPIKGDVLNYDEVMERMDHFMDWLAKQYITALNIIHYMHDKYSYEASLMALHDRDVIRTMACGIAGLSVAADSLSAIKYAKVKPIRDEDGLAIDFEIEGEYPQFGNNDPRVDDLAVDLVERFMKKIQKLHTYRDAIPTQSVLTITSNVVYGKKTGNTPDGRRAGAPFGPGANPMHGRDQKGAVASLTSVAKLPFAYAKDGISYTFSIVPNALGKDDEVRKTNLAGLMDGYFHHEASIEGGQHLNVNVMNREMLLDAMENPEKYPQLTIRVSGYAVRFNSLTKEQQQDVITRTFTQSM